MRKRLVTVLLAVAAALLAAPAALADGGGAFQGTVEGPGEEPVEGVEVVVSDGSGEVGRDTSDSAGEWRVELPEPGRYTISFQTESFPEGLVPREAGDEEAQRQARGNEQRVVFFLVEEGQQQTGEDAAPSASPTGGADEGEDEAADGTAGEVLGDPEQTGGTFGQRAVQLLVLGVLYGLIIAITAIGLSLIFGTTRLINFAHGDMVTLGAILALVLSAFMPFWAAALLAVAGGALFGGATETFLWRPLRRRGVALIQMFIISIGLSLFVRYLINVLFGPNRERMRAYQLQESFQIGPVSLTPRDVWLIGLSVLVLVAVGLMLQFTRIGKAMRAVSDNRDLARSSGIDVDRVTLVVWMLGGALAALGGIFYGLSQSVHWQVGFHLLLLMFAAVILGGLGTAYGAMVGGLVVGIVAQVSTLWFPAELQNAWALGIMIIVLLVRPQGILGRAERVG
ncbi:branched-chain amino acid ABC transporter permease [Allonocardiopsis opalescens]|uniref:Amino acid/amide ABC transporter membrane protein 1 (HAAT family) n=1 Tax=Allonocardiopsis opalescens TaxID=1144618 RepID=A0A2T0Q426_9ACTN|nr:branched-chain amino acid ABC transporter permease [Allonocardiopsis opalescens]PRX98556.1 amino acid/amide ABC transporter membrane protein 1 (HAAT family) [Allonocardiopsis opalescens]